MPSRMTFRKSFIESNSCGEKERERKKEKDILFYMKLNQSTIIRYLTQIRKIKKMDK